MSAVARSAVLMLLCLGLAACRPRPQADSIQQVMDKVVDPSADLVWDAVKSTVTAEGELARRPASEAEWQEVRAHALRLIDGARLLQQPRPVGGNGHSALADADTPGTRTTVQIAADIKADPANFYRHAAVLEQSARKALAAIDAHDAQALVLAGEGMDLACESCHAAYWYPRNPFTPFPGPGAFAQIAGQP